MRIRAMDMFCGGGGSSAGARLAGAEIAHGIDAWDLAAATFQDNFEGATVDCRTLQSESRPPRKFRPGDIDLLLASPECTNHSPAKGSKPRSEDSRRTSLYVLNYARALRPRWIVIENVVQLRNWPDFDPLLTELRNLGYRLNVEILDAAEFGVPQSRRRLFVVADRKRDPVAIPRRQNSRKTAADIIDLNGHWRSTPLYLPRRAEATLERAERAIRTLGRGAPFLIVYYGSDGAGGWQTLDRPLRTLTTLDRFGLVTWLGREPLLRMLQVEELRMAMGLPENHRFDRGSRRDKLKMIGNGVCPPVMQAIVESLAHA